MTTFNQFETWWNAQGFDPKHPLYNRLQKLSDFGANPDVILNLCVWLVAANVVYRQMIGVKKRLASRKSRWTKEFRALCGTHTGGKLRLTETAQHYTDSIIRSTVAVLKAKGQLDPAAELADDDVREIKQRALEPFANMQGYHEDWEAAIDNARSVGHNSLTAVGFGAVTPEQGEAIKKLMSAFRPVVFQNGATKRRDEVGTMFLLFLTEHLRKTTTTGKPHFALAFNLLTSLQGKQLKSNSKPTSKKDGYRYRPEKSAEVRVAKLKQQCPEWPAVLRHLEHAAEVQRVN